MGDGSKLTTGPGGVAATNDDGTPYIPGSNPNLPQNKPAGGQAASPAKPAAPTGTTAQGDDEGNTMITKPDGTTMVVGPDGNAIKPGSNPNLPQNKPSAAASAAMTAADQDDADMGAAMRANVQAANGVNAQGQNVTMPGGINPETGDKTTTTAGAPAAAPAGGQAASPAKPAAGRVPPWVSRLSPSNFAQATQLGLLKNGKPDDAAIKKFQTDNGLKSDGIIGPQTIIAVTSAANLDKSGGAGRGGQGGPTAAQMAQANASKPGQANAPKPGQAASPAAGAAPDPVKDPAGYKKYMNDRIMKAQQNKQGGQAASPAALPGKAVPGGGQISSTPAAESIYDDIVLQRIRELSGM
jgi:hypothetical protein